MYLVFFFFFNFDHVLNIVLLYNYEHTAFLSVDVSTTMILTPGPVVNFLRANQNVENYDQIDWGKVAGLLVCVFLSYYVHI